MKQSEIINVNDIICFHCQSKNTLKHGKSSNNTQRYKCKDCSKTFSFKLFNSGKNELSELTETYLNGSTIREIAYNIHCSVIRLNHKIRKFLTDCPKWEDYLDSNTNSKNLKVVYLTSKKFAVKNNQTKSNYMYLLIAEDVLSSVVIGFDIVADDNEISWSNLLNRTNKRAYEISQFLFNGNLSIEKAINKIYPKADKKITFGKVYRNKEINCCLMHLKHKFKLLNDTINFYKTLDNQKFDMYLIKNYNIDFEFFIKNNRYKYIEVVNERSLNKEFHLEYFINSFEKRFKKFRMIKDNPFPLINGWIAMKMLYTINDLSFNYLSMLNQVPQKSSFNEFSKMRSPQTQELPLISNSLSDFAFEIGLSTLRLPLNSTKCELNYESCPEL